MPPKLNTHYYDGKMKDRYQKLQNITPNPPSLKETTQEITKLIKSLIDFSPSQKTKANHMLQKLILRQKANHDTSNQIWVPDLLPLVWYHVKNYETSAQKLFLEQILDIYRGPCPPGRTTRLLQCVPIDDMSLNECTTKL
jgi:hypothetical protein